MAQRGRGREGRDREFMRNFGDGIKNDCKSKGNRNEIKRLSEEVTTLCVLHLQRPTTSMDRIALENCFGVSHCRGANFMDNELLKFCGSPLELVDWLNSIESIFEYHHVTEEKKVKLVLVALKGELRIGGHNSKLVDKGEAKKGLKIGKR